MHILCGTPAGTARARRAWRGIALVAVLAVLTILALLAMAFAVLTSIEQSSSAVGFYGMSAQALADAGLEHAKAVLWSDAMFDTSRCDTPDDLWRVVFDGQQAQRVPDANVDVVRNNGPRADGNDAVWIPVRDAQRRLIGRYAVLIQDECAKININAACIAPPNMSNEGLSPREIMLCNCGNAGLPLRRRTDEAARVQVWPQSRAGHA